MRPRTRVGGAPQTQDGPAAQMVAIPDALLAVPGLNRKSKAGQDYVGIREATGGR